MNKRALESLVKCGALDSTGATRQGMVLMLDQALSFGGSEHEARSSGQGSIFDLVETTGAEKPRHHAAIPLDEYEKSELLRLEKETLGLWISEHPLSGIGEQLRRKTDRPLAEIERCRDGEIVTVGGIVSSLKALTTKRGDPMVFLRLDDLTGSAEAVVFNSVYAASRELCETDRVLVLKGRVDHKEGESKLIAIEVTEFEAYVPPSEVRLKIDARKAPAGALRELGHVVRDYPGEAKVVLNLETSDGPEDARVRAGLPRRPGRGLLRRGEGAPRRSCCSLGRGLHSLRRRLAVCRERDRGDAQARLDHCRRRRERRVRLSPRGAEPDRLRRSNSGGMVAASGRATARHARPPLDAGA